MNIQSIPPAGPTINLGDIYYVLFRHKWKIILCSLAGIVTAAVLRQMESPIYQSEAKLLVRYIVTDTHPSAPGANDGTAKIVPDERGASIMSTEAQLLYSLDLARQVAVDIGPEKILASAGTEKNLNTAIAVIRGNLEVRVPPASSVINVTFKHPDPDMVEPILNGIIQRYFKLHLEAHRGAGEFGNSLETEADQLRSALNTTEDELRQALAKGGIISIGDAKKVYAEQINVNRRVISSFDVEVAGRKAILETIRKGLPQTTQSVRDDTTQLPPDAAINEYKQLSGRIDSLQKQEQELLYTFTAESSRVQGVRERRLEAENTRKKLVEQYPVLNRLAVAATGSNGPDALVAQAANIEAEILTFEAKLTELKSQNENLRNEIAKLDKIEGGISDLQRKRDLQEINYRYLYASLEASKINETLGSGKVSNIVQFQKPSPPIRLLPKTKQLGVSIAGGILLGLGWAFLIELFLDRSVRRPSDVEKLLKIPLFLSIPKLARKDRLHLTGPKPKALAAPSSDQTHATTNATAGQSNNGALPTVHDELNPLNPFHETLRDRLINFFDSKNLTHKPKLVAVTGLTEKAGVTTTAAGLARSLSETGEGNVLFVDMTVGQGSAQQFVKGRAVCGLDELLDARDNALIGDKLYVVAESSNSERLSRNLPQRFTKLIPKLKSSDFDYIIFDMPPVNQISITPRLAGFMDMILLVIESEKTDRELVQRASTLLADANVHVGVVLNKTRDYVPTFLPREFLGN